MNVAGSGVVNVAGWAGRTALAAEGWAGGRTRQVGARERVRARRGRPATGPDRLCAREASSVPYGVRPRAVRAAATRSSRTFSCGAGRRKRVDSRPSGRSSWSLTPPGFVCG
ncbi:unannotated protein [freshwater metagenome]|uniref:Unannotated protein n=1 Tax=freshwater metagenome TaxID=449393 RepID=A0A6J7KVI5_9ZZZZ